MILWEGLMSTILGYSSGVYFIDPQDVIVLADARSEKVAQIHTSDLIGNAFNQTAKEAFIKACV